jgi:hypothetical protein
MSYHLKYIKAPFGSMEYNGMKQSGIEWSGME